MHWRPIRADDLQQCLEIEPACIGDALTGRARALQVWRELIESPALYGSVFESDPPIAGHHIVGGGIGVFVDPSFVDRELAKPEPGMGSRIIASSPASGRSLPPASA